MPRCESSLLFGGPRWRINGWAEKRSILFLFPDRRTLGLHQIFEVFNLGRARVHKLEANVKLILAMSRVLVVGDDAGLDSPGGLSVGGGNFDHQNGPPAGIVIHEEMVNAHLELIGLKAGPLDGNRGQASFGFIGPGPPGDRIPNAIFHLGAYGMPGIPATLPAQVIF